MGVILAWLLAVWLVFPFAAGLYRSQSSWTFTVPETPLQMGIMATTSSVAGWRNYAQKSQFVPGERLCLYAEALNVNKGGQVNLSYTFTVANPMNVEIYRQIVPSVSSTTSPSSAAYPCFALPANAQAGNYFARASIYDTLNRRTGQNTVQFTVALRKGKKKVVRPPPRPR
ncbi:MAG: hypothetical protein WDO73_26440 [Ignavibacteriota bacterium]